MSRIFFHADLVYYDYMPGVALLHCIKQHTVGVIQCFGCKPNQIKTIKHFQVQKKVL